MRVFFGLRSLTTTARMRAAPCNAMGIEGRVERVPESEPLKMLSARRNPRYLSA